MDVEPVLAGPDSRAGPPAPAVEPRAAELLRRARWRLAFARYLITPAIVALWLIAAYVIVFVAMISWTFVRSFTSEPPEGAGQFTYHDGSKSYQGEAAFKKIGESINGGRFPFSVTVKGKRYEGREAREKMDEWLATHVRSREVNTGRFVPAWLATMSYLLAILFLAGAILFIGVAAYLGFFFLPFLLTLPLSLGVALSWSQPARFLVLRPFRHRETNRPLRRIIARSIAGLGHTYTLADADIQVPWYIRVPILVGQLSFFAFHRRTIRKPKHIESLVAVMRRRRWRSLNWCVTPGRVFPVASKDDCWQDCVRRMVGEADVVLFDVTDSENRPNLQWELALCRDLGLDDRVVFLAHVDGRAEAEEYLHSHGWPPSVGGRLFDYTRRGPTDEAAFQAALSERLACRIRAETGGSYGLSSSPNSQASEPPGPSTS